MKNWFTWLVRALFGVFTLLLLTSIVIFLIPVRATIPSIQPRKDTQYWHMQGGYRIAYSKLPPANGGPPVLPVIFLHGGPGGYVHSSVITTLQALATAGHAVYLYDQHGSGLSDRLHYPKDSSFNDQIKDLHEIIDRQLGLKRVILIGHSHGARIAAYYAAQHPDSVTRIVMSSPGNLEPAQYDAQGHPVLDSQFPVPASLEFHPPDTEQYRRDTELTAMPPKMTLAIAAAIAFNVKTVSDAEADAALNSLAARFTRNMVCDQGKVQPEEGGAGFYVRTGANWFGDVIDPRPEMRRFPGKVLVLQGQCDFVPYSEAYEYVNLFPKARYQFVPLAGHIIWWEQSDIYVKAIAEFLAEEK